MKSTWGLICLGLVFAGDAGAACSAADQRALEAFDRAWGEAGRRGDKAALEAVYSDRFMALRPGAPAGKRETIDGILADAAAPGAGDTPVPKHDFYLVHCDGDNATITHRNAVDWKDGNDSGTFYSRSVHHMVREGGQWRVLADAGHALTEADVVGYLDLEWNLADLAGDKAWFERMLASDYTGVSGRNGALEDKKTLVAEVGRYKVGKAITTDMEVSVDDDFARVTGIYHSAGTDPDGKAYDRRTRYIDTFVKRDGRWQIWSSQGTPITD
jgi:ketosteroid isomerase-like protein